MNPSISLQTVSRIYERHGRRLPAVVNLLLVALLAYLLAKLLWLLIPVPEAGHWQPAAVPPAQTVARNEPNIAALADAHLFGAWQPEPTAQNAAEAPDTRLSLNLLGILASTPEQDSRALIAGGDGDEKPYALGDDVVRGVKLQAIFADRVVLSRNGQLETLRLNKDAPTLAMSEAPRPVSADSSQLARIRTEIMTDPSKAAQYIRIQPANINGQLKGFRVYPGRERGAFNQLGLRPGDLITSVNGVQLDDSQKALQMLTELAQASSVSVTIERGGQTQNLNVNLN